MDWSIHDSEVIDLYRCLIKTDRYPYEMLRNDLIWKYGYDEFRELQKKSFELMLKKAQGVM